MYAAPIGAAGAQNYPNHPIRVVVTAPPGGVTDLVARLIGTKFQESFGAPWVIDNRGGANGIIGTDLIAKSAPDGYSVVMVYVSHSVNSSMYKKCHMTRSRIFHLLRKLRLNR